MIAQRLAAPATEEQIKEAVHFIQAKNAAKLVTGAQLVRQGWEAFAQELYAKDSVTILTLREIPHFPIIAGLGAEGRLLVGKTESGNGVACLVPGSDCGFLPSEASFLAKVLAGLGVSAFFFTATGAALDSVVGSDAVVVIDDGYDFTTVRGCGVIPAAPGFATELRAFANSNELLVGSSPLKQGSFIQFPGPTFPTPTEQSWARDANADFIGKANL